MAIAGTANWPAWRIWLAASRPKTLPAAIAPVVVGTAIAHKLGGFAAGPALAALLGALLLQIGANFANDYFDWKQGADTAERQGPMRVTQAGLVSPSQILTATAITFGLATLTGVYLTLVAGWPIVVLGLASILAAIAYTGGPFPLGYRGLGEVTVFVFFGLAAVMGTVYVQVHSLAPLAAWLSVPMGALSAAILVVNNLRDRHTDAQCGKRTIAVRFGGEFTRSLYVALLTLAFGLPCVLVALGLLDRGAFIALLALPLAVPPLKTVLAAEGPVLNGALAGTARLLAGYALALALGLLV
ncbi:MAG TPA: 1,4-dihydroxy-2-naphthoate polyprenyltransferase [Oscillatoriaceae cyanobacterium]